jgi:hypothetical protein
MDKFIEELKKREEQSIVEVMAFMSYNPSIGRVLEKGGVKVFQEMAIQKVIKLKEIKTKEDFDTLHKEWILEFIDKIKTNKNLKSSYGQAQKAINVFLKLFVDWANLPDEKTAKKILPFLHVPLDRIIMKTISKKYVDFYKQEIKPLQKSNQTFSLSVVHENIYMKWQNFFRIKYPEKPLLFDIIWAINR